ncbi:MAG: ArsR/SmtB family transcription factor [Promethearchaeota archaeon]
MSEEVAIVPSDANRFLFLLELLSNETRLKILRILSQEALNPEDLAKRLKISRPAVEKHIKKFKQYGIIRKEIRGYYVPRFMYLTRKETDAFLAALFNLMRRFVEQVIETTEEELDELERDLIIGNIIEKEFIIRKEEIESCLQLLRASNENPNV